jgi:hypothetical protein
VELNQEEHSSGPMAFIYFSRFFGIPINWGESFNLYTKEAKISNERVIETVGQVWNGLGRVLRLETDLPLQLINKNRFYC